LTLRCYSKCVPCPRYTKCTFFQVCYIEAAQNLIQGIQISIRIGHKKLTLLNFRDAILRQPAQNFIQWCTIFDWYWAQKTHLTKLVQKSLFWSNFYQILSVSFFGEVSMKAILRQHKILFRGVQFLIRIGQKKPHLTKLVLKCSVLSNFYTKFSVSASLEKSVWKLYWGSTKFYSGAYNFWSGSGTKNSPYYIGSKTLGSEAIFTKFSV
jgi:hypothetical protein